MGDCGCPRNKLGFALQLCVLRHPGRLLAPGEFVPPAGGDFIGRQGTDNIRAEIHCKGLRGAGCRARRRTGAPD